MINLVRSYTLGEYSLGNFNLETLAFNSSISFKVAVKNIG